MTPSLYVLCPKEIEYWKSTTGVDLTASVLFYFNDEFELLVTKDQKYIMLKFNRVNGENGSLTVFKTFREFFVFVSSLALTEYQTNEEFENLLTLCE